MKKNKTILFIPVIKLDGKTHFFVLWIILCLVSYQGDFIDIIHLIHVNIYWAFVLCLVQC